MLLSAAPFLRGQSAPTSALLVAATIQATVELSPFIVATGRDIGWSANDTLSATRTRQALKDVPVNIDAITADFMEDLGLFSADEVTKFVANVYAAPAMETARPSIASFTSCPRHGTSPPPCAAGQRPHRGATGHPQSQSSPP
ncbi:MAG: hypothetical protein EXS32_11735 [Opitutus sp.]|nr:hypothetical protein [Opitutus sp.]